jgi:hypothetical protein
MQNRGKAARHNIKMSGKTKMNQEIENKAARPNFYAYPNSFTRVLSNRRHANAASNQQRYDRMLCIPPTSPRIHGQEYLQTKPGSFECAKRRVLASCSDKGTLLQFQQMGVTTSYKHVCDW